MKSLMQFIEESMKTRNAGGEKLSAKEMKRLKAVAKKGKKQKNDPKLAKYFKNDIKESDENLLNNWRSWVEDTIDSWVQAADDDYDDMAQLRVDLEHAEEYFSNNIGDFYEEFDYGDDVDIEDEYGDDLYEIVQDVVERTIDYLADTYDHWDQDED